MRTTWIAFLFAQLATILSFWAYNHIEHPLGNQLTGDLTGMLLAYGRLAGLFAAFATLLQCFLIGRIPWLERIYGHDRLLRLHHVVGFSLLICLVAHPILVTFGHAAQAELTYGAQAMDFIRSWEDVAAATVAFIIMLMAIGFSVFIVLRRMNYELWYWTHLTFYAAIALAFGHQLSVGSDFTGRRAFQIYWVALYVFVFLNLIVFRFVRPLVHFFRHRFRVISVTPETDDVTSVRIAGIHLERLRRRPGQFVLVRFLAPGFRGESHPFSVSSHPDELTLRLTIKQLGDFTRKIPSLPVDTRVIIDGPHGIFTPALATRPKIALFAGGIGITPLRIIAETFARESRDVILLYGNRNEAGIALRAELDAIAAAHSTLKIIHILSDDPRWPGEKGRFDTERILRLVPDIRERDAFLCGPPPMMKSVRGALHGLGMTRHQIHDERFSL